MTAVAAVTMAALLAQAATPRFSSEVELVTLDVVAVDAKGNPVVDLTRDEFVVKENGIARDLVRFESFGGEAPAGVAAGPATEPVAEAGRRRTASSFALIVDDLGMGEREMSETRDAVTSFVTRIARDGDSVTLAATSGSAWWTAIVPGGRGDLLAIIGRLRGRETEAGRAFDYMSDYEAFAIRDREEQGLISRIVARWTASGACSPAQGRPDPTCPGRVRAAANAVDGLRRRRAQGLLSTLRRTIEGLAASRGRKSVVLYSRGFLQDTDTPARDVADAARTANAAVYFIDTRGLQTQPGLPGAADAGATNPSDFGHASFESGVLESGGAQKLAVETGGFSVRNSNDFSAAGASAARDSRAYYLLGFDAPPDARPGVWRNLSVEVTRPGVNVRARKGYALRAPPKPAEAMTAALQSAEDATGIPVRARAFAFEPRPKKLTRLLVAAEFDADALRLAGGSRTARLALGIAVVHRDTGAVLESSEQVEVRAGEGEPLGWRSVAREFDVAAGVSQIRVVLRDAATGTAGSATHRVEVASNDSLRMTTPILTDRAEAKAGDDHPRAALAIARVFRNRGPMFCEFEVLGARVDPALRAPRVTAGIEVRDASGAAVRKAEPTQIAPDGRGRIIRLIGMGMDGLPEGGYELRIAVRDEVAGTALERTEAFALRAQ